MVKDYAMFSEAGNREIANIVDTARYFELSFDEVMELLHKLAEFPKFGEATDTAVREEVGYELGFYE
jgi:hypothetical protein